MRRLAAFVAVGFGPLVLAYGVVLAGLVMNVALLPRAPGTLSLVAWALALTAVLVASVGIAQQAYPAAGRWLARAGVLYGVSLVLTAVLAYVVASALAGVSMAVVEGVADRRAVAIAAVRETLLLTAAAHGVLVPWVAMAAWVLRRRA